MIGNLIKFMRVTRNMKQADLSKKTKIATSTISNYETDSISISAENLNILAEACNFELLIKDKKSDKIYKLDDMKRFQSDIRVRK